MMNRLSGFLYLVLSSFIIVTLAACGGGGGGSPVDNGFGTASFVIEWPAKAIRLAAAESVRIVIRSQSTIVANQVFDRLAGASSSTFQINPVPTGDFTVTATAYPLTGGGGSEAGTASSAITIRSRQTTSITFSASAAIDHIEIVADKTSIPMNANAHLVAIPRSATGSIIFVPQGNMSWQSLDLPIATVDSAGVVTGVARGNADIKVTETDSGMNATVRITVSGSAWTVLVYMAADNNLESYALQDMNEMEAVWSTSSVPVVVQVDRSTGYDTTNGDWSGARRYYITKDSDTSIVHSQMITDLGPTDMAAPSTLTDFIHWATTAYPAEHYLLVLWDHGRGWRSRTLALEAQREVKSIFADESAGDEMTLPGLTQALEQSPRQDVILFDACLMGMLEVAYSIRNCADVMVASEENVPVYGHAYDALLSSITTNPSITSSDLGTAAVNEYIDFYSASFTGTFTASAVNLLLLDDLVSASDNLAGEVLANMTEVRSGVETAQVNAQHFDFDTGDYRYYKDLYDFARRVNDNVSNASVKTAAQNVMSKLDDAVILERHAGAQMSNAHGISIYLPTPGSMLSQYSSLDFSTATRWDDMIAAY
jgi:hypothetical protein